MESRKVQETGGSTYTVSLPKKWIDGKVDPGDQVFLSRHGEDITISLEDREKSQEVVQIETGDPGVMQRKIVALYIRGVDKIVLRGSSENVQEYVRENLIGMETTAVKEDRIELRNLFNHSDMRQDDGLRRMSSVIIDMMEDLSKGSQSLREREQLLDRYYLMQLRQLRLSIRGSDYEGRIDSPLRAMEYRVIAKSMERIGDHLKIIAEKTSQPIEEMEQLKPIFSDLRSALFSANSEKLESVISRIEELELNNGELERHLERVRRLMLDISESATNYSIDGKSLNR